MLPLLQFTNRGLYCPEGQFYIDPWLPVDYALITHGHSDHAKPGMKNYLCHHYTKNILRKRIGIDIKCQTVDYGQTVKINGVKVSFHPSGHIIGASQIRLEKGGYILVVSGDYKVQNDGLSTPIEIIKCHEFVTESTFGLPIYQWATIDNQMSQLHQWVLNNQKNGKTSVFIGYALGKAQRLMHALHTLAPLQVHYSIAQLNEAYKDAGIDLPPYETINFQSDLKHLKDQIVILPPSLVDSQIIKRIPQMAYAICSGWMQVRGARRWRNADAGFAISDHADWQVLLKVIKETGAHKIHVTHGQIAVFTKYLQSLGLDAYEVQTDFGKETDEV